MLDSLIKGYSQNADLFWFEVLLPRIQRLAYCAYCHVIRANSVTSHPPQLSEQLVSTRKVYTIDLPYFQVEISGLWQPDPSQLTFQCVGQQVSWIRAGIFWVPIVYRCWVVNQWSLCWMTWTAVVFEWTSHPRQWTPSTGCAITQSELKSVGRGYDSHRQSPNWFPQASSPCHWQRQRCRTCGEFRHLGSCDWGRW